MTRAKDDKTKPKKQRRVKKPNTKSCWVALDPDVAEEFASALALHQSLETRAKARSENAAIQDELLTSAADLEVIREALLEESIKFVFKAIGHSAYDDLVDEHPFDPEDSEAIAAAAAEGADAGTFPWNPKTFPIALISVAMISGNDGRTPEEIAAWVGGPDWNSSEMNLLFTAALEANTSRRIVQMGNASRRTRS